MHCITNVFLAVLMCTFGGIGGVLSPGDPCTIARTQQRGICELLTKCPSVQHAKTTGQPYMICCYKGRREVVCCPPNVTHPERISERKCREYGKTVYRKQYIYEGIHKVEQITDLCGHKVIPLVVGGKAAQLKEFPHMALLGYQDNNNFRWGCGGSLISDQYVMTAAHCLEEQIYGTLVKVRLGELDLSTRTDGTIDINVSTVFRHPNYTSLNYYNDIGLVRLRDKVVMNEYIKPACLPTEFDPAPRAIATGWGAKEYLGNISNTLQKVTLDVFTHNQCPNSFRVGIKEQLCAGSRDEIKDTCQSDSGGPLQVYHTSVHCMYTINGVTSVGAACGSKSVPGIYTRVFTYLDWIESIVWS